MATTMAEPMQLNEGMDAGLRLQVSKVIRAKRARVFEAWTKPEIVEQWFGGEGRVVQEVTSDLRVGGSYRIEMGRTEAERARAAAGEVLKPAAWAGGVYREIVVDELLSFTWGSNFFPGEQSLVTVSLRDADGGTEVTIVHERFLTEQSMRGHEMGWIASLQKLQKVCEG